MQSDQQKIMVLDYGSQYTQLIARRVRELGVYCKIFNWDITKEEFDAFAPRGVILSGGPFSVYEENSPFVPAHVLQGGVPILGTCYGMQTMADRLGGNVSAAEKAEFGLIPLEIVKESKLLEGMATHGNTLNVWMCHGDQLDKLPPNFEIIAKTATCPFAVIQDESRKYYAAQFHTEVTYTENGLQLYRNFVLGICGCEQHPVVAADMIDSKVAAIREQVKDNKVMLAFSGGLNSSVTAMLLHKAIGDKLTCVFVDTGLLTTGEMDRVKQLFAHTALDIHYVDAHDIFFSALEGLTDPEDKRRAVGHTFIKVFEEEAKKIPGGIKYLAQGTVCASVIESAMTETSKASQVLKSHHNVGGLPKYMDFELVEPLRELFYEDVVNLGKSLKLADEILTRHPFPGVGLAIRVVGEVRPEYVDTLRKADSIFMEELNKAGLYNTVSQAFAVFLPIRSVGGKGDARTYSHVISLRAVDTIDFITAYWAELPYSLIKVVSNRITNEIRDIGRVVYDVSSKSPATIEWE